MPIEAGAKKWTSLIWKLTTALAVSLLLIAALIIGLIAKGNADHAIGCINTSLGSRNAPSSKDARAHVDFAKSLQMVLIAPKDQQSAQYQKFLTELNSYVHTLVADQQARDAKPLGKC